MRSWICAGMFGTALLTACGDDGGKSFNVEKNDEKYRYSFDENGCKTGDHSFKSKSAYCDGLKDEGLNNGCAYRTRMATYQNECS